MARLINPSQIRAGDKVVLSLEAAFALPSPIESREATISNLDNLADIENVMIHSRQQQHQDRRAPWSVTDIEPGVAGGGSNAAVLGIEDSFIIVAVKHVPPRLLRMAKRSASSNAFTSVLSRLSKAPNEEIVKVCHTVDSQRESLEMRMVPLHRPSFQRKK